MRTVSSAARISAHSRLARRRPFYIMHGAAELVRRRPKELWVSRLDAADSLASPVVRKQRICDRQLKANLS